ncbi:hypothetical protein CRUP_025917 [Coryphaenoides rupestris]|nr:hypothetical protein CRUP_025917 [Coryphaenoides rupestris]
MDILNKIISKHAALKTDGFSIESCRSMVAVMDVSSTSIARLDAAACFPLNDQLYQMIIRRYSDESGNLDFDNYIGCLWLQLTMYS